MGDTNDVLDVEVCLTNISVDTSGLTLVVDAVVDGNDVESLVGETIPLFEEQDVRFLCGLVQKRAEAYE